MKDCSLSSIFKILVIGISFLAFWPCRAEEDTKIYEIGLEPKRLFIEEVKYYFEDSSIPFDLQRIKAFRSWNKGADGVVLSHRTVLEKRVVISFDIVLTAADILYFNYGWASPLKFQGFFIVGENEEVAETNVISKNMFLVSARLAKGKYRVYFVAEPHVGTEIKFHLNVMNSAHFSSTYITTSKFHLFVYGVGTAFIFFNFTMFLLHRKVYFIYYVGYSATILYLLAIGTGDLRLWQVEIWNLCLILNCLFTILLTWTVLRPQESNISLLYLALGLWGVLSVSLMAWRIFDYRVFLNIGTFAGLLCYLTCIYVAVRRMQSGYVPATFFALGWGFLALGYGLNFISIYYISIPYLFYSAYIAYAIESMLFAVALAYRTRDSEQRAVQDKVHALSQLKKVVYPHQMEQITAGGELESTMPTTSGHACVISFDIIGSSKIKHIRAKTFFRNVFTRCNAIMSEGYDGKKLKANAYRIKEMGDGFLCSVGYPFLSMTDNPANESVDLARRFAEVLIEEAAILHADTPIACGIGIALDTLTGFYPEAGTKEYDIYGQALVLATRYEGMRKTLFEAEKGRNILIIQEVVFQSLDPSHRAGFKAIDLKEVGITVRDDPAATKLYYQFLDVAVKAAA